MANTVRISDDALAIACGADAVAAAFIKAGETVERVSSWGMQWLEPLVEINGIGFGPATAADVPATATKTAGIMQCTSWAGDGSHRTPMMTKANETPAIDSVRITVTPDAQPVQPILDECA